MERSFVKNSVSLELADALIERAFVKARELGRPMVVAIVDESGLLKAFKKMDGTAVISIEVAQNKAYSAVVNPWGYATHEIYEHISKSPSTLLGMPHIPRYTVFGGGFPIIVEGKVIGGIGISGGNEQQDILVAKAALSLLA